MSDIIVLGNPYSTKIILYAGIKLSADNPSIFVMIVNLLW